MKRSLSHPKSLPSPTQGSGHTIAVEAKPRIESNNKTAYDTVTSDYRRQRLHDTVNLLRRGKWTILITFMLVVGSVVLYLYHTPSEYETYSLLLIDTDKSSSNFNIEEESRINERRLSNEAVILRESFQIASQVSEKLLDLEKIPETSEPFSVTVDDEGQLLSKEEVAFRLHRENVDIRTVGNDIDMIRIVSTSTIPEEAALIANLFAEAYIERTQEKSRSEITATRSFLEEQEVKLKDELTSLEAQLESYMSVHGAAALDEEASQIVLQVAQLESMRDEVNIDLEMKQATVRSLDASLSAIEPNLIRRVASGVEEELESVQSDIVDWEVKLETIYLNYPHLRAEPSLNEEVMTYNRQISEMRDRAERLAEQYVGEVLAVGGIDPRLEGEGLSYVGEMQKQLGEERIAISGLQAREQALQQRLREYQAKLRNIPGQSIQLAQIQRARQSKEQLYLLVAQRLQEARINEESELGYAQIVRPAFVPTFPSRPRVIRELFLAVVFGLVLGLGLAVIRKMLDTRLYQPADLVKRDRRVIGVVPNMTGLIKKSYHGEASTVISGRSISTTLNMLLTPFSLEAEAWRQLRTSIQFTLPNHPVRTLLVTSPEANTGKSTVAANLAVAMAHDGKRTLLVDTDLRRPRMHKLFGYPSEPGLIQLLYSPFPFNPGFFATDIENLFLIPTGGTESRPSEILGSEKMQTLIERFRESFDFIIFDAPPALPFTDALLVSSLCEGTVVVANAGKTDVRAFDNTVNLIQGVGGIFLGAVMNRLDKKTTKQLYMTGYSYGYGKQSGFEHAVSTFSAGYPLPLSSKQSVAGNHNRRYLPLSTQDSLDHVQEELTSQIQASWMPLNEVLAEESVNV